MLQTQASVFNCQTCNITQTYKQSHD